MERFEHYLYWLDSDQVQFDGEGADEPLFVGWSVEGVFQSYIGWDGTDLNALALTKEEFPKSSLVLDQVNCV